MGGFYGGNGGRGKAARKIAPAGASWRQNGYAIAMPIDARRCRCHVRFTDEEMKLLKQVGTKEHRTTPELVRHATLKWLEQQEVPTRFDPSWMAGPPQRDLLEKP